MTRECMYFQTYWAEIRVKSSWISFLNVNRDTFVCQQYRRWLQTARHGNGPVLVHCSAGIGRTGVLVTIDIALSVIEHDLKVCHPVLLSVMIMMIMTMIMKSVCSNESANNALHILFSSLRSWSWSSSPVYVNEMQVPVAVEEAGSVSWSDGIQGHLNQALDLLCLVLHTLIVFINYFILCWHLVAVVSVLLVPATWLVRKTSFFAPVKWLAEKIISEVTYTISNWSLWR